MTLHCVTFTPAFGSGPARALLALGLLVLTCAANADPLGDILRCNAEALGGDDAFARVDNLRIELDIEEPGFEVTGTWVGSRDGRMRIDVHAGGERVFAEGLDGERAWQWTPGDGVSLSDAQGKAALRHGIEAPGRFYTLQQLRARGARIELLEPGSQARGGEWQIRLAREDGTDIDFFLDRSSCLLTREVSHRAFHPDIDRTEVLIQTVHGEPVEVDGVLRFRLGESSNLATGEWLGTTRVRAVQHNVVLAEAFFEAQQLESGQKAIHENSDAEHREKKTL
jgi:hypothetical protein